MFQGPLCNQRAGHLLRLLARGWLGGGCDGWVMGGVVGGGWDGGWWVGGWDGEGMEDSRPPLLKFYSLRLVVADA